MADCKSGNSISPDQDKRYGELEPGDLTYHVEVGRPDSLKHTVCYVDTPANHRSLAQLTRFPFITFGPNSVEGHGSFGQAQLDEKMLVLTTQKNMVEPDSFYPFAPDDSRVHAFGSLRRLPAPRGPDVAPLENNSAICRPGCRALGE